MAEDIARGWAVVLADIEPRDAGEVVREIARSAPSDYPPNVTRIYAAARALYPPVRELLSYEKDAIYESYEKNGRHYVRASKSYSKQYDESIRKVGLVRQVTSRDAEGRERTYGYSKI